MEIGKDAIMEKIESDTFKKIVEERQTELGNDVGENFISKVSIELDRLPSGEADRSFSSKDLYEEVLKMKDLENFIKVFLITVVIRTNAIIVLLL